MPLVEPRARRVLVVDDDPSIRELIQTRLDIAGFTTRAARHGAEALEIMAHYKPEAMVLDINMPVLDGFGVLAHMQSLGLTARTPTMVLTARNRAEDVTRALQMGARDYMSKPFRDEQLIQRVGRLLARPRATPVG